MFTRAFFRFPSQYISMCAIVTERQVTDNWCALGQRPGGQARYLHHTRGSSNSLWTPPSVNLRPKSHSQVTPKEQVLGTARISHRCTGQYTRGRGGCLWASPCSLHGRLSCKRLVGWGWGVNLCAANWEEGLSPAGVGVAGQCELGWGLLSRLASISRAFWAALL